MGAGKTTLGKALAETLKIPFYDTDELIEEATTLSIAAIFSKYGEAYFRNLEKETIENLPKHASYIVATGGGLPCFNHLIEILNSLGTTIYLKHDAATLTRRLATTSDKRPLLTEKSGEELISYVQEKVAEREVIYAKADVILEQAEQTPEYIIHRLNLLPQKS